MNCNKGGKATVTVTGAYGGKTHSATIEITVEKPDDIEYITVKDAIAAQVGETVTVKGIVGPSLVNQDGFYLFNDDAFVAIKTTTDVLATLEIGHEVILEGKRDLWNKTDKGSTEYGQTCISNCTVKANYYGKHEYKTDFFIKDQTAADFYALDVTKDYSTTAFVFKVTVEVVETAYYTNIKIKDGNTSISLYCSSASQYEFLKQFNGKEITVEIAACNWNDKNFYAGCVLAVITEDGKIINRLNFD
jgi:hypothetical protein